MVDYVLKRDENGMVRYLYRNDGKHPYVGKTKIESAEWMLRQGEVRVSEEYEGFPVTANGMYFFEAEVGVKEDEGEATSSDPTLRVGPPSPKGEGSGNGGSVALGKRRYKVAEDGVEIGADGAPIPAGDGGKRRRKKRIKDEVCQ